MQVFHKTRSINATLTVAYRFESNAQLLTVHTNLSYTLSRVVCRQMPVELDSFFVKAERFLILDAREKNIIQHR